MGNCLNCNCDDRDSFEVTSNHSNFLPPEFVTGSRFSNSTVHTFLTDTYRLNFCTDENRGIQCSAILGPSESAKIPSLYCIENNGNKEMGCSSSRVDKPCHEAALIAGENSLMYSLHEISTLFPLIKAISKDGRIRKGDFKTFLKNNKLAGDEKSFEFYKRITVDKGFELTMVATLAAILCKGSNEQKISALMEAWTAQDLNKERASEIFDCIFDLAVEFLPILVAPPTIENNYTPDELNHFLQRAKSGRERAKFDILKEIFSSDTVNKKDLIDWFNKNTNSTWLVSHTVRENLKEIGKKARKEKKHKSTQDAVLTDNKSSGMLGKTSQSLDVHASHEINSVPISEVIEKHHYNHHHHEHHEGIVDASE